MPHFFIKTDNIKNNVIEVNEKELLSHLTGALRIQCGERLKFIDENEIQYETTVIEATKKQLCAEIKNSYPSKRKLKYDLRLIQSVLKPDAQALLISSATQCGVSTIIPVLSDNCTVSKKTLFNKVQKWQKISDEAAKQCERANRAAICDITCLKNATENFEKKNVLIYAEKHENIELEKALCDVDKNLPIAVVIGPEGGFSEEEFKYFIECDYKLISLGNLIFKAPNAVVAGISNIVTRLK